ncbi:TPA: hypothetical protein ACTPQ1_004508 [Salmonella enterica]
MFGVFRERNRLRHRVEVLELELTIAKVGLGATKETYQKHLRDAYEEQRKLTRRISELQSENRKLEEEMKEARRDADLREKLIGWNFGALVYFTEKRWGTEILLKTLYEKLSLQAKRCAAKEYFRSHGYEVKDE